MLEIAIFLLVCLLVKELLRIGKRADAQGDNTTSCGVLIGLFLIGLPLLLIAWAAAENAINIGGALDWMQMTP